MTQWLYPSHSNHQMLYTMASLALFLYPALEVVTTFCILLPIHPCESTSGNKVFSAFFDIYLSVLKGIPWETLCWASTSFIVPLALNVVCVFHVFSSSWLCVFFRLFLNWYFNHLLKPKTTIYFLGRKEKLSVYNVQKIFEDIKLMKIFFLLNGPYWKMFPSLQCRSQ